ncbi:vasoactive intestinal polypeptide receptor 2-like isoform X2 [Gasterosteus aculeatus]
MSFTHRLALLLLGVTFIHTVNGKLTHCQFQWEMQRARRECDTLLQRAHTQTHTGCLGEWDNVSCWQRAAVGEVLTLPCPPLLVSLFGKNGNLSRTCTETGWSGVSPPSITCWSNSTDEPSELVFYRVVKILSTLGHSLTFITLLTSTVIICLYRKLHCTRNYVHLNLFLSFMLRAAAVLSKDTLLFSGEQNAECSAQPSLVGCKVVLVFFNYFVMANFFWLLVEGLYLHTLLLVLRSYSTRLPVYLLIGWGIPLVFMAAWIACRINLEDTQCWEMNENPIANRLMNWPIMASVMINFVLFVSIIRILVQKLRCPDVGGNEQSQYRSSSTARLLHCVHHEVWTHSSVCVCVCVCVRVLQASGQVHPPADPSVRNQLRAVRLPDGAGRHQLEAREDLLRARPHVLPGFYCGGPLLFPQQRGPDGAAEDVEELVPAALPGAGLPDARHVRQPQRQRQLRPLCQELPGRPADGDQRALTAEARCHGDAQTFLRRFI